LAQVNVLRLTEAKPRTKGNGMKSFRRFFTLALFASFAALASCDEPDGPAEKAGEAIDEAVQDTKRAVEDATD
jgi:hypothetical protein